MHTAGGKDRDAGGDEAVRESSYGWGPTVSAPGIALVAGERSPGSAVSFEAARDASSLLSRAPHLPSRTGIVRTDRPILYLSKHPNSLPATATGPGKHQPNDFPQHLVALQVISARIV